MYHSDEPFVFLPEYVDELTAIHAPAITRPERYFLVAATGTKCWTGARCATATRAAASASCRAATTACPTSPAGCPRFSNSRLARSPFAPIIHLCPELHNDSCTTAARARRQDDPPPCMCFTKTTAASRPATSCRNRRQPAGGIGIRQAQQIKRANTLFTFAAPEPAALMSQAAAAAEALDLQFLWECAPQEEFDSPPWPPIISATPHAGRTGRAADATARRARLFPPPRQGPLSPRPPDILAAALAALEKSSVRPSSSRNGSMKCRRPPARKSPRRRNRCWCARQEFPAVEGAGRSLRQAGQDARPPAAGPGRLAARTGAAQAPLPGGELPARAGLPRPAVARHRARAAAGGCRDLFGGRHHHHRDRRRALRHDAARRQAARRRARGGAGHRGHARQRVRQAGARAPVHGLHAGRQDPMQPTASSAPSRWTPDARCLPCRYT